MAVTTAPHPFHLEVPIADDTMSISSDTGQRDRDIDIDIDPDFDTIDYEDDDQMLEDVRSDRGMADAIEGDVPPNDDVMADEYVIDNLEAQDGMMQDETISVAAQDEELLDFSDDEVRDDVPQEETGYNTAGGENIPHIDNEHETNVDQVGETHTEHTAISEEVVQHAVPEDSDRFDALEGQIEYIEGLQEQISTESAEKDNEATQTTGYPEQDQSVVAADPDHSTDANDEVQIDQSNDHGATGLLLGESEQQTAEIAGHGQAVYSTDAATDAHPEAALLAASKQYADTAPGPEENLNESIPAAVTAEAEGITQTASAPHDEHVGTPTITGLHPTIVRYQGSEVALFPSSDPASREQYFLQDENLVNGSIGDLLQACRVVLGRDITEDEELEMRIDDLGLYVSEDSTPAFSTSFSEMLDLYVQLQVNDGVEHPAPLYISFGIKIRFTNRMTLLANAASEGKGLSQVPAIHGSVYDDDFALAEEYEEYDEDQTEFYDGESIADDDHEHEITVQGDESEDHAGGENLEGVPEITDHLGRNSNEDEAKSPNDAVTDEHSEVPFPSVANVTDNTELNAANHGEGTAKSPLEIAGLVPDEEKYIEEELPAITYDEDNEAEYLTGEFAATHPSDHTEGTEDALVASNNTVDNEDNFENMRTGSSKENGGHHPGEPKELSGGDAYHEGQSRIQGEYGPSDTGKAPSLAQEEGVHDSEIAPEHETIHEVPSFLQVDGVPGGNANVANGTTIFVDHTDDPDEIDFDDEEPFEESNDVTPSLKRSWDHGIEHDEQTAHEHDIKRSRAS